MQFRWTALVAGLLSLSARVPLAQAESLPANVRACIAEPDATRRLACFDRETARYVTPAPTVRSEAGPAAGPAPGPAIGAAAGSAVGPTVGAAAGTAPAPAVGATAGSAAAVPAPSFAGDPAGGLAPGPAAAPSRVSAPSPASGSGVAPGPAGPSGQTAPVSPTADQFGLGAERKPVQEDSAARAARHLSAHVVSVEFSRGGLFVHLDNDQVWERVEDDAPDLNLHAGDTVQIDQRLGAYWLSGRSHDVIKVRRTK